MVLQRYESCTLVQRSVRFEHLIAVHRMTPHFLRLIRIKRRWFVQNGAIDLRIADIMKQSAKRDLHPIFRRKTVPPG
ncbi:hypothetical protein D3C84_882710 [compost metagenome]